MRDTLFLEVVWARDDVVSIAYIHHARVLDRWRGRIGDTSDTKSRCHALGHWRGRCTGDKEQMPRDRSLEKVLCR